MRTVSAFGIAFALFVTGFILHIVGGTTNTDWLFQFAVVVIFVTATGFPATVMAFADVDLRSRAGLAVLGAAFVCGYGLTLATLWAANDRSFAAWQFPAAALMVVAVRGLKLGLDLLRGGRTLRRA